MSVPAYDWNTARRPTLINDIHCRDQTAAAGGFGDCDIDLFYRNLRRTLHNRGEYVTPL
jgi:hypothetical protein